MSKDNRRHHAWYRIEERLIEAGFDPATREKVYLASQQLARLSTARSEAIRLLVLDKAAGDTRYGNESNGDEVWAIVRADNTHNPISTFFLRRSSQPKRPGDFGVEKVTLI